MEQISSDLQEVDFGGQNQIVNQQEQQRQVNPGGLTQTDSEETLNGPAQETVEADAKIPQMSDDQESRKREAEKEQVSEQPVRRKMDAMS